MKLNSICLAAGLAISLATAANADPILEGSKTDPTGIDNLVVDGTIYDVTFGPTLGSFTEGSTLSNDAVAALVSALNTLGVTELGNSISPLFYEISVDNSSSNFDGPGCFTVCGADDWTRFNDNGVPLTLGLTFNGQIYFEAADFRAVGEPWTLGLFGTGLAALFMLRRRTPKLTA